jgi:fatty acid desaturase
MPPEKHPEAHADTCTQTHPGTPTNPEAQGHEPARQGPLFWTCLLAGWGVLAFGLVGLLLHPESSPPALFRLLVGLNVANVALVAPAIVVVAALVRRAVPRWAVAPVGVGLIATAVVVVYAYPLVGGFDRTARAGSSRLPLNYTHSLAMVLGAIWFVCAAMALWAWRRRAHRP